MLYVASHAIQFSSFPNSKQYHSLILTYNFDQLVDKPTRKRKKKEPIRRQKKNSLTRESQLVVTLKRQFVESVCLHMKKKTHNSDKQITRFFLK